MGVLRNSQRALWVAGVVLLFPAGCIDTQARYDAFLARSANMRAADSGVVVQGDRFDFSGRYLFALETTLAPGSALLFQVDATVASDLSTFELVVQPLTTDMNASPRTLVGDVATYPDIAYAEDGSFELDFGEASVPGAANPISASDIVSDVQLTGTAIAADNQHPALLCGKAGGMVTVPITVDLAGSTFGAVRTDDIAHAELLTHCPQ